MSSQSQSLPLKQFNDYWGKLGDPALVERKFNELLPQAKQKDTSIYLQLLSQIALAQALQKKFNEAHATIERAQTEVTADYPLAQGRIFLEHGRVFHQEGNLAQARVFFDKAYAFCQQHHLDMYAIDAAHMIGIIAETSQEKIAWNEKALSLTEETHDERARSWQGSLYNNLGQNYLDIQQYEKALEYAQKALELRKKEGYAPNIRAAQWRVGLTLRLLGRLDEALALDNQLIKELAEVAEAGNYEMPEVMFKLLRGYVYEELTEIYMAFGDNEHARFYAEKAYKDLSNDEMFKVTCPERLVRLQDILGIK